MSYGRGDVVGYSPNDDSFDLKAVFSLRAGSNGINPVSETVTLVLGTGQWTIPAGSFDQDKQGRFKFQGFIGLTFLDVQLSQLPDGSFEFKAEGSGAELTGTTNPVPVSLTIGNDSGSTTVLADIRP